MAGSVSVTVSVTVTVSVAVAMAVNVVIIAKEAGEIGTVSIEWTELNGQRRRRRRNRSRRRGRDVESAGRCSVVVAALLFGGVDGTHPQSFVLIRCPLSEVGCHTSHSG